MSFTMEDANLRPPNNSAHIYRLEIKQKNAYTKKRRVKTWSPEEDDQLVKLYEEYPKKWGIIAGLMQDRNQNQCLHRYRRLSQLGAHKKIWSSEEDQTILSLIKKVGKNWKLLAQIMGTKTGKQIRERFINKLDPRIKTEQWTDQQDKLILKYYSQVGSRWSQISKRLPGRPQNKIKNRFYSFIQKNYDIRYICVQDDQRNDRSQKLPVLEVSERKFQENCLLGQPFSGVDLPKIVFSEDRSEKPIRLREVQINSRFGDKQPSVRRSRKCKLKTNYSRFCERGENINRQNIFEDQNSRSPCPKKPRPSIDYRGTPNDKREKQEMPSLKELDDEFKIIAQENQQISRLELPQINGQLDMGEEKDQIFESNGQITQRYYIKSLIRVDEQYGGMQSKYRSIRDIVSNNEIENHSNQLLYLSHN